MTKTIRIQGCDFDVRYPPLRENGGADISGSECTGLQTIFIDSTMKKQQQEATVLHEIIEAVNRMLEIDLEHHQIVLLETGLYQALNDNGVRLGCLLDGVECKSKNST
jgi:hypothetical protein